jgi:hypothetical protein
VRACCPSRSSVQRSYTTRMTCTFYSVWTRNYSICRVLFCITVSRLYKMTEIQGGIYRKHQGLKAILAYVPQCSATIFAGSMRSSLRMKVILQSPETNWTTQGWTWSFTFSLPMHASPSRPWTWWPSTPWPILRLSSPLCARYVHCRHFLRRLHVHALRHGEHFHNGPHSTWTAITSALERRCQSSPLISRSVITSSRDIAFSTKRTPDVSRETR